MTIEAKMRWMTFPSVCECNRTWISGWTVSRVTFSSLLDEKWIKFAFLRAFQEIFRALSKLYEKWEGKFRFSAVKLRIPINFMRLRSKLSSEICWKMEFKRENSANSNKMFFLPFFNRCFYIKMKKKTFDFLLKI